MEATTPGSAQERKLTVSFKISELCNCYVIIWKADADTARWQGKPRAPMLDFPAPGRGSLVVLPPPVAGRRQHRRLEGRWMGHEDSENPGFEPWCSLVHTFRFLRLCPQGEMAPVSGGYEDQMQCETFSACLTLRQTSINDSDGYSPSWCYLYSSPWANCYMPLWGHSSGRTRR